MKHALFFSLHTFRGITSFFYTRSIVCFIYSYFIFYGPGDFFSEFLRHILHVYPGPSRDIFYDILTI